MDLRERTPGGRRHPWEMARVAMLRRILREVLADNGPLRVLDYGCGDGYVSRELLAGRRGTALFGLDTALTEADRAALAAAAPGFEYGSDPAALAGAEFDLVLLLHVIEHQADDEAFLEALVRQRLRPGGQLLVTAPAFPALFSAHDRFFGHFRRYTREGLSRLVREAGLVVESSGYAFTSLLAVRAASAAAQRLLGLEPRVRGAGGWRAGDLITAAVASALRLDIRLNLALNGRRLQLPGLEVWALCGRPRSSSPASMRRRG